jgi:uncharacterized membrane protein
MNQFILSQQQIFVRKWDLNDNKKRSIVKTITWRVTGSGATFLIAFMMTGSLTIAGTIGLVQMFSNTLLYYVHERIWNRINWGKIVP